jgi:hypothetical protein
MFLHWGLKIAQAILLACLVVYLLVLTVVAMRVGDERATYIASAISLAGVAVSGIFYVIFRLAGWIWRRRGGLYN